MMGCFSVLFAKKPSPDPSLSSGNIGKRREAPFNQSQNLSSENDEQIVQNAPVEVATEEGQNDFRNIVAKEGSTQIIGPRPTIARNVFAGTGAFQVLGNYTFLQSSHPAITYKQPPPPYSKKPSTQTESSAGENGGL